jgi:hypothetical protein
MNIGFKKIGVFLLLVSSMTAASAGSSWWPERDFVRSFQMQRAAVDRGEQRNDAQMQGQAERRRDREFGSSDSSGNGSQSDNSSNTPPEASRRQGKLSPEERRALRRQIDEAGHDIYAPKR